MILFTSRVMFCNPITSEEMKAVVNYVESQQEDGKFLDVVTHPPLGNVWSTLCCATAQNLKEKGDAWCQLAVRHEDTLPEWARGLGLETIDIYKPLDSREGWITIGMYPLPQH